MSQRERVRRHYTTHHTSGTLQHTTGRRGGRRRKTIPRYKGLEKMEEHDVYIFDEVDPLERTQRNVLFYQAQPQTMPTYLVQLPNTVPEGAIRPQQAPRSRATTIVNTSELPDTIKEEQEPLESYVRKNLPQFRKSLAPKDFEHAYQKRAEEKGDKGSEFVIPVKAEDVESAPWLETQRNPSTPSDKEFNRHHPRTGRYIGPNNKPENRRETGKVMDQQISSFTNEITVLPLVMDNVSVEHQTPFVQRKMESSENPSSKVKVMLMVDELGKEDYDGHNKNGSHNAGKYNMTRDKDITGGAGRDGKIVEVKGRKGSKLNDWEGDETYKRPSSEKYTDRRGDPSSKYDSPKRELKDSSRRSDPMNVVKGRNNQYPNKHDPGCVKSKSRPDDGYSQNSTSVNTQSDAKSSKATGRKTDVDSSKKYGIKPTSRNIDNKQHDTSGNPNLKKQPQQVSQSSDSFSSTLLSFEESSTTQSTINRNKIDRGKTPYNEDFRGKPFEQENSKRLGKEPDSSSSQKYGTERSSENVDNNNNRTKSKQGDRPNVTQKHQKVGQASDSFPSTSLSFEKSGPTQSTVGKKKTEPHGTSPPDHPPDDSYEDIYASYKAQRTQGKQRPRTLTEGKPELDPSAKEQRLKSKDAPLENKSKDIPGRKDKVFPGKDQNKRSKDDYGKKQDRTENKDDNVFPARTTPRPKKSSRDDYGKKQDRMENKGDNGVPARTPHPRKQSRDDYGKKQDGTENKRDNGVPAHTTPHPRKQSRDNYGKKQDGTENKWDNGVPARTTPHPRKQDRDDYEKKQYRPVNKQYRPDDRQALKKPHTSKVDKKRINGPNPNKDGDKPPKNLTVKAPKSATKMMSKKRYHIQIIPENRDPETWFNVRFNLNSENDVGMNYEGPVKINNYYSSNNYS